MGGTSDSTDAISDGVHLPLNVLDRASCHSLEFLGVLEYVVQFSEVFVPADGRSNSYIGMTTTTLSKRLAVQLKEGDFYQHYIHNHGILQIPLLLQSTTIINGDQDRRCLRSKEALHIMQLKPSLNITQETPAAYKHQAESTYMQSRPGSCWNPRESSKAHESSGEQNNQSECRSPRESSGESSYPRPRSRPSSTINHKVHQIVTLCSEPVASRMKDAH